MTNGSQGVVVTENGKFLEYILYVSVLFEFFLPTGVTLKIGRNEEISVLNLERQADGSGGW